MKMLGLFGQIGWGEILLVLAVIILLFGARKLPDLAKAIRRSGRELRGGFGDDADDDDEGGADAEGG